jgi:hypothetical protein
MPRDYNIVLAFGGDRRGAFGGGNIVKSRGTLNSAMYSNQDNGDTITKGNLKKVLNVGLAFNTVQKGNEIFGAYTENRLRQRKIDTGMTFAKYGIGLMVNPVVGGIYAISDLTYRATMYGIKIQKMNREANYFKNLSGNNAFSGSRYRGDYV